MALQGVGFWFKDGKLYPLHTTHIDFIIRNPELFEITLEEIKATYKKYNEKLGWEGKARKEIIVDATKKGWIRIREYKKPVAYFSIQTDYALKKKNDIIHLIQLLIEQNVIGQLDKIAITSLVEGMNNENDYLWGFGEVGKLLGSIN